MKTELKKNQTSNKSRTTDSMFPSRRHASFFPYTKYEMETERLHGNQAHYKAIGGGQGPFLHFLICYSPGFTEFTSFYLM